MKVGKKIKANILNENDKKKNKIRNRKLFKFNKRAINKNLLHPSNRTIKKVDGEVVPVEEKFATKRIHV